MAGKKLRVGVIGCGAIAQEKHLPFWQELEGEGRVELIATCDALVERAQASATKFGARRSYGEYDAMLRNEAFDIVDVCTQNRFHCPATVAALKAGANVLVEKPMAMNTAESLKMIQTANQHKRTLMVAQHMRFEAGHERLKEVVERGELGQVYSANATWLRRRGIPGWGKFHIKKESLGGPLIDIGVHMLDLVVWLMGSPRPLSVTGKVYRKFGDRDDLCNGDWGANYCKQDFDVEDYCSAYIRFERDITLTLEVSWAANIPKERFAIGVLGDKAGISTNPLGVFGYRDASLTHTEFDWLPRQIPHRMEIRHFADCVANNLPVRVQPAESLQIQRIIDAIYESSRRNREVVLKQDRPVSDRVVRAARVKQQA